MSLRKSRNSNSDNSGKSFDLSLRNGGVKGRRSLHESEITKTACAQSALDNDSQFTKIKPISNSTKYHTISKRKSLGLLVVCFSAALLILYLTYRSFPKLDEDDRQHVKLPMNIEDAKKLGIVLTKYRKDHYYQVLAAVFLVYIFLQTFAIPGSIFLSILSGYLFPFYTALTLVCTCSAIGASLCYGITQLVGRRIVMKYFPERVGEWSKQVDHHREHMLNYIIFLRITPFLPNWFINIASPVINVELTPFALGTFIGVAPPSFFAIQAGTTLYEVTAATSNFTVGKFLLLGFFAILSLLPVLFKKRLRSQLE